MKYTEPKDTDIAAALDIMTELVLADGEALLKEIHKLPEDEACDAYHKFLHGKNAITAIAGYVRRFRQGSFYLRNRNELINLEIQLHDASRGAWSMTGS